jgi:hypothetical protein
MERPCDSVTPASGPNAASVTSCIGFDAIGAAAEDEPGNHEGTGGRPRSVLSRVVLLIWSDVH